MKLRKIIETGNSLVPLVLRITLGIVMFPHGAQKVFGWFGGQGFSGTMAGMSHQYPAFLVFLAIMAEFLGSLGVFVGLFTRIAAFGIMCNMLVAIFQVHMKNGLFMNWMGKQAGEGFEYHLLVIGICVVLMIYGGGAASVDRTIAKPEAELAS